MNDPHSPPACPLLPSPPLTPRPPGGHRDAPLPLRLFECSDVILLAPGKGSGAANRRRLVAVYCDRAASFEVIHGLLNRIMEVLHVPYAGVWCSAVWCAAVCGAVWGVLRACLQGGGGSGSGGGITLGAMPPAHAAQLQLHAPLEHTLSRLPP